MIVSTCVSRNRMLRCQFFNRVIATSMCVRCASVLLHFLNKITLEDHRKAEESEKANDIGHSR
jgi:hypothetical protein